MPYAPQPSCLTPRCAGRAEYRGRCRACNAGKERQRGTARERGYLSPAWRALRLRFLAAHPWCFYCDGVGRTTKATCVDHYEAVDGPDDPLFLDEANLRASCWSCHTRKTNEVDGGLGRTRVGVSKQDRQAPVA